MRIIPSNTSFLIACLCFLVLGFAVPGSTAHSTAYAAEALSLWDGEAAGSIYHYGEVDTASGSQRQGNAHFAGAPDKWHEAGIGLNNLASWRADLREYDELRFYAKTTDPNVAAYVRIYAWPHFSAPVDIGPLSEGGSLSTEYRLVRVPFELLATEKFSMSYMEIVYFGAENPPEGYRIYIDDMHAAHAAGPVEESEDSADLVRILPGADESADPSEPGLLERIGQLVTDIVKNNEAGAEQSLPGLSIGVVTSHSVALSWNTVQEAEEIRIILGPEPPDSSGSLAAGITLATLPGFAAEYTIEGLSANVSAFIRVEAALSGGHSAAGTVAVQTIGGPRSPLATPLRQVHAYAPDILMLVLENKGTVYKNGTTANNQSSQWQNGPWRVLRGDKSEIKVTEVWRDSIPVSQPDYGVGFGAAHNDNVVDIDHRIFLKLSEPIGNRDMLTISGPAGLSFLLPFSDLYLETPVIQLNQVSYNPRATSRWAYVSGWMGDGGKLSLGNFPKTADVLEESESDLGLRRTVVADIPLAVRANLDADAGTQVAEIDLSAMPESNDSVYRVRIPGVGVSWQTRVSEEASNSAYITIIRGLFHNRWGGDLSPEYTEHSRPVDHAIVYRSDKTNAREFHTASTEKNIQQTLQGGYHDAGDFDQRPMHVVVPQLLMRAHEINGAAFPDRTLSIPESGNGIPDLLDEALWGIAAWEQLQDTDGGVRMGVESTRHPLGIYYAHQDQLTYWTYGKDANHTARVAGLFAQASRLVAPYDAARAAQLEWRAHAAYRYAKENGAQSPNLLYASGELYRLTGSQEYQGAFEESWSRMGTYGAFSNFAESQFYLGDYFNNTRAMPDYVLGYMSGSNPSDRVLTISDAWISRQAHAVYERTMYSKSAHRSPRTGAPDWGNGTALGKFLDPVYAAVSMGKLPPDTMQKYFNALSLAMDYSLGGNPDGMVYFTGMGMRRVEEPLHLDSLSFIKDGKGPIPGIPVFGPVQSIGASSYLEPGKAAFYPSIQSRPLMRRYADIRTFVATNEFTVWETQAPHAELAALLYGGAPAPQKAPAANMLINWYPVQNGETPRVREIVLAPHVESEALPASEPDSSYVSAESNVLPQILRERLESIGHGI